MNVKSAVRTEKIFIFIFLAGIAVLAFFGLQDRMNKEEKDADEESGTVEKIGSFDTMKLYMTDYIYNTSTNGYIYTEVVLSSDIINSVKNDIKELNTNSKTEGIVYGQYKLVLDDKVIYYDIDNDSAMMNGKIFKFPKNLKLKINTTTNTCSCCTTSNCNINLCKCNG